MTRPRFLKGRNRADRVPSTSLGLSLRRRIVATSLRFPADSAEWNTSSESPKASLRMVWRRFVSEISGTSIRTSRPEASASPAARTSRSVRAAPPCRSTVLPSANAACTSLYAGIPSIFGISAVAKGAVDNSTEDSSRAASFSLTKLSSSRILSLPASSSAVTLALWRPASAASFLASLSSSAQIRLRYSSSVRAFISSRLSSALARTSSPAVFAAGYASL